MKGHLRQRGDSWEARVYVGKDVLSGKERYATRTIHGSKKEAERVLNRLLVDAERGTAAKTGANVGELLMTWFEFARHDFSPKTVRETRGFIDRDLVPALGDVPLTRVTAAMLDKYYAALRSGEGRERPLAPATIRRIHGILRRALQQGVRWEWLGANPAASASPPRIPPTSVKPPSPETLGRLLELALKEDPDFGAFLYFSATTGARRSEVIALRWTDILQVQRVVLIARGVVIGDDGRVEKTTKTHASRRLALDDLSVQLLAGVRERAEDRAHACGIQLSDDAYVFAGDVEGTTTWYPDSVSRSFRQLCKKAGVGKFRLHDLRHYVATQLLTEGVDVRTVAGRLGHRNAATTLNVYSHFIEASDRDAADVLSGLVGRSSSR
ncbi:tyrosine-type recombinase/integrase [Ilumatobacter nonamiensis]|uniref:tyrosine-type recombinase/integrase n=1 Tax=Ilumatobacter nonamiensis TaxID=467093 RepID=UPI000A028E7A|nr:site-specific integrase [Ilumatobacter nonamiensis]